MNRYDERKGCANKQKDQEKKAKLLNEFEAAFINQKPENKKDK